MGELALASLFLLVSHFGLSSTGLRPWLIARLGAPVYLAGYSLIAFAAIFWLVSAYRRADVVLLWQAYAWQGYVALIMMLMAVFLFIGGATTPNPTVVGKALVSQKIDPPTGVLRITRHPTMWVNFQSHDKA